MLGLIRVVLFFPSFFSFTSKLSSKTHHIWQIRYLLTIQKKSKRPSMVNTLNMQLVQNRWSPVSIFLIGFLVILMAIDINYVCRLDFISGSAHHCKNKTTVSRIAIGGLPLWLWDQNGRNVLWYFFKIDLCSTTSMESSRWDLMNAMAEHRSILKNYHSMSHPCFGFTIHA